MQPNMLRRLRADRGWTREELARRSGVCSLTIKRIEMGVGNPTIGSVRKVAHALGVPLAVLFQDDTPDSILATAANLPAPYGQVLRNVVMAMVSAASG